MDWPREYAQSILSPSKITYTNGLHDDIKMLFQKTHHSIETITIYFNNYVKKQIQIAHHSIETITITIILIEKLFSDNTP